MSTIDPPPHASNVRQRSVTGTRTTTETTWKTEELLAKQKPHTISEALANLEELLSSPEFHNEKRLRRSVIQFRNNLLRYTDGGKNSPFKTGAIEILYIMLLVLLCGTTLFIVHIVLPYYGWLSYIVVGIFILLFFRHMDMNDPPEKPLEKSGLRLAEDIQKISKKHNVESFVCASLYQSCKTSTVTTTGGAVCIISFVVCQTGYLLSKVKVSIKI